MEEIHVFSKVVRKKRTALLKMTFFTGLFVVQYIAKNFEKLIRLIRYFPKISFTEQVLMLLLIFPEK